MSSSCGVVVVLLSEEVLAESLVLGVEELLLIAGVEGSPVPMIGGILGRNDGSWGLVVAVSPVVGRRSTLVGGAVLLRGAPRACGVELRLGARGVMREGLAWYSAELSSSSRRSGSLDASVEDEEETLSDPLTET